ncbi:MAG: hypothetical protein ACOX6S_06960 [Clostridia bacterium]|jgi:hypothetical protein
MINNFFSAEARDYIVGQLLESGKYRDMSKEKLEEIVDQAIVQDKAYMEKVGIITDEEDPRTEEVYYDDDDAFEYILDGILDKGAFPDILEMTMAQIIDDYMEFNEMYLEEQGLISWDE